MFAIGIGRTFQTRLLCCFARLVMFAIVGEGSSCCPWLTCAAKSGLVSFASQRLAPNTDFVDDVSSALIVKCGGSLVLSFGFPILSANSSWLTSIAPVFGHCCRSDPQKVPLSHPLAKRKLSLQCCDRLLKQFPSSTQQDIVDVYPHDSN